MFCCFVEKVCVNIHKGYWPAVYFSCDISLSDFSIRIVLASQNELGSVSFSSVLSKNLGSSSIIVSSLNLGWNSSGKQGRVV